MSADLHSSSKNSFYSNLIRLPKFYDLPDFNPIFLTDAKIKHYLDLTKKSNEMKGKN